MSDISAQRPQQIKKKKTNVERFTLSPFFEVTKKDSIRIITYVEIPFRCLSFIKKKDSYLASYQTSISIKEKNGDEHSHIVWSDSIVIIDYEETNSNILNRKHFSSIQLPINRTYNVIAELQDNDTRKKGTLKKKINLKNYSKTPLIIKPNFLLNLNGDWGFKYGKIPTQGYGMREIGKGIDLQISGFVDNSDYTIEIFINNNEYVDSLLWTATNSGVDGIFNETVFIPSKDLKAFNNDFTIAVKQNNRTDEKKISLSYFQKDLSMNASNIDLAIKQMKYILSNDENRRLKKLKKDAKKTLFLKLWKDRDPTQDTEFNELMDEYYRRVRYADENFDGWQRGWESDRGMVYVLFGPPDEIQRSNQSISASINSVQIWTYVKTNKQFIFRDQNGFGDYKLDNPFYNNGL